MTDREKIREMFDRAGVKYSEPTPFHIETSDQREPDTFMEGPNQGYVGFYTSFEFHPNGDLKSVGSWE